MAMVMIFGVVLGFFLLLQSLKITGIIPRLAPLDARALRGAALQAEAESETSVPAEKTLAVKFEDAAAFYAAAGQQNVPLLSFTISSSKAAKVNRMAFSLSDLAMADDLESLQLFIDGELLTERAFFEGKGVFDNIHLRLHPGEEVPVEVKGQVSGDATPGHRVQIGFRERGDLVVQSIVSEPLAADVDFPAWGPAVSLIGRPL